MAFPRRRWAVALAAALLAGLGADGAAAEPPAAAWRVAGELSAEPEVRLRDPSVGLTQQFLRRRGHAPGLSDGRLDTRTREAIRSFQRECGLPAHSSAVGAVNQRLVRPESCPIDRRR